MPSFKAIVYASAVTYTTLSSAAPTGLDTRIVHPCYSSGDCSNPQSYSYPPWVNLKRGEGTRFDPEDSFTAPILLSYLDSFDKDTRDNTEDGPPSHGAEYTMTEEEAAAVEQAVTELGKRRDMIQPEDSTLTKEEWASAVNAFSQLGPFRARRDTVTEKEAAAVEQAITELGKRRDMIQPEDSTLTEEEWASAVVAFSQLGPFRAKRDLSQ